MLGSTLLSGALIVPGIFLLVNGGTLEASFFGFVLLVIGAVVFWNTSATKRYLDGKRNDR